MPSPRLPATHPDEADEELRTVYDEIAATRGGQVGNVFQSMSASPATLRTFARVGAHFRTDATLEAHEKELLVLAIARDVGSTYQWTHHARAAERLGLSVKEAVREIDGSDDLRTSAIVGVARSVASGSPVTDADIARLAEAVGDAAAVEVVVMSAYYLGLARVIQALDVQVEAGVDPVPFDDQRAV